MNPLQPSASLLCKLGSLAIHASEMLDPIIGRGVDRVALSQACTDPEVVAWLAEMGKMAMIPVRRTIVDVQLEAKRKGKKK